MKCIPTTACSDSSALYTNGNTSEQSISMIKLKKRIEYILRSLNVCLSVFSCSKFKLSSNVSIFCGGSFIANKGLRLGRTTDANCGEGSVLEIKKILGRIEGNK